MANVLPGDAIALAPPPKSRLIAGAAILAGALVVKIVGPALIVSSDLPTAWKTGLTAALFIIVPKILIVSIVFLLGKAGFAYLKSVIYKGVGRALAPLAPPKQVSRTRYRIGLVLFTVALLEAWLFPYLERNFPGLVERHRVWDWFSDGVLIASIFVLGGDFWDKLRALYIHGARVQFPPKAAQ
jgi:hypothetical protein